MKTIGYLVNTFLRPSEGFIYEQVAGIKQYNVEVLTREYVNQDRFPYGNVNALANNERFSYTLRREASSFNKLIIDKDIRLLHAHFGVEGVYALPIKRKFNLPLITTFHGHDITRLPKFTLYPPAWFNYWMHYRELQREGDLFLAVSNFIAQKLIDKGFPEEKVKTHYLGINTDVEVKGHRKDKKILTAGRLVEKKGTNYLIRAMAKVVQKHSDALLIICGDGPLKSDLQKTAENLGLGRNILFKGWTNQQELFALMNNTRIFALPSVTAANGDCEGLGMVFLEAMARAVPCIGTRHGGIPDVVLDNETGFLVPERDPDQLADRIISLLSDQALCDAMGKRGRELACSQFNIVTQIQKLEALYKGYLG
jgi:glycosyltransferase involved in cell wall biosynthesis